jgi:hypothetical protein
MFRKIVCVKPARFLKLGRFKAGDDFNEYIKKPH